MVGHGHWDHAGQLSDFPNAVLYIQREELRGDRVGAELPATTRSARSTPIRAAACARPPAATRRSRWTRSTARCCAGKAVIVDGEMEILPGVRIHPAFRAHTAGSQLLEVPTSVGKLVFGSDAYSSWEAIRDWMVANVQQTDSVQQFLAYEKCYKITGGYENCVAAHEPLSYTDKYPLTKNSWVGINGSRMAEIALGAGRAVAQALEPGTSCVVGGEPTPAPRRSRRPAIRARSRACALCWFRSLAAGLLLGERQRVAHDPSAYGGLFRSRDLGATWLNADAGLFLNAALTVAVDPRDPAHLLLGTDLGLMRSATAAAAGRREAAGQIIGAVVRASPSWPDGAERHRRGARAASSACDDGRWTAADAPDGASPARAIGARRRARPRLSARPQRAVHQR